jgi:signal transduction histidine kinase
MKFARSAVDGFNWLNEWWTLWRQITFCTALYSLSRISLGITYSFIPKAQLPPALQDWTVFPIQLWGALWTIAGVLGVLASVRRFDGRIGAAAIGAMVFMNSFWTMAYSWSWLNGQSTDNVASSTYAGTSALIVALGLVIATLRRRYPLEVRSG